MAWVCVLLLNSKSDRSGVVAAVRVGVCVGVVVWCVAVAAISSGVWVCGIVGPLCPSRESSRRGRDQVFGWFALPLFIYLPLLTS